MFFHETGELERLQKLSQITYVHLFEPIIIITVPKFAYMFYIDPFIVYNLAALMHLAI